MSAAEAAIESETRSGGAQASRYIDFETAELDRLARTWLRLQETRKALGQQGAPDEIVQGFDKLEKRAAYLLKRALRKHPLWPWLSQFPGLGGAHVALVIGRIGDPRRFPGQRCTEGHYLPAGVYAVGSPCPVAASLDENDRDFGDGTDSGAAASRPESEQRLGCLGTLLAPRPHSGTRSLQHWAGLHVLSDGTAPRKRKGQRIDWEPRVRASVMQPGGIAEQIVRLNVPHYADVYRANKARLTLRVVDDRDENESINGDVIHLGAAENSAVSETSTGRALRPFEADRIARKVAAKKFLGDLLVHWKTLA